MLCNNDGLFNLKCVKYSIPFFNAMYFVSQDNCNHSFIGDSLQLRPVCHPGQALPGRPRRKCTTKC